MLKFIRGIMVIAAPLMIAGAGAFAPPVAAAPGCMTVQEARKAFPSDHLYWHGLKHCWNNVSKAGSRKPAAETKTADAAPAPSANDAPAQNDNLAESANPASANHAPVVPFIADDPNHLASWSPTTRATSVQQEDPAPTQPEPQPAAQAGEANVVIGAPNAKPGSPDYLLEHCCWPPSADEAADNSSMLPRMVVASAGAFGLAAGLWLFVYRRRRPLRLQRVDASPSIHPERTALAPGMTADLAGPPRDLDERRQPPSPDTTLAMYAPKRVHAAARTPYRVS